MKRSRSLAVLLVSWMPAQAAAFAGHEQRVDSSLALRTPRYGKNTMTAASNDDWWIDESANEKDLDGEKLDSLAKNSSPFLQGEELRQLRSDLESYRENLKWAEVMNDKARIESLSKEIEEKEQKDPEVVYNRARKLIAQAKAATLSALKPDLKEKLIKHWSEQADMARACLPRFHMEG